MAKKTLKPVSKRKSASKAKSADVRTSKLSQLFDKNLDLDHRDADRPTRPFAQSEWVFICVDQIIKAARSIQMILSTASEDIVETGEAYDLLFNNPQLPFSKFITETAGYLAMYRECYWIFPEKDVIRPRNILVAGPDQVEPVIERGYLVGYKFYAEGSPAPIPLLIEDVWPLIDFNPGSAYRGIGPCTAGKLAISTAYQAALMNEATLANGGKLSGIITLPAGQVLNDEERRFLIGQFESRHKGARNAGKWALMTGGADVKPLAQTMADLQMIDLRRFDAATICSLFGVPIEIVNLNSEAQYAHGPAQQRLILNTVAPLLHFIAENITMGILRPFRYQQQASVKLAQAKTYSGRRTSLKGCGSFRQAKIKALQSQVNLFAWFAVEDHPTVQEMLRERTDKVMKYVDSGIPLNQIIDAYDLPFEHVAWGDDHWISMGMVPARFILEAGPEALTGPQLPEGETEEEEDAPAKAIELSEKVQDDPVKLRLWKNWVTSWAGIEREYAASIRTYFIAQQRIILDRLKKELGSKSSVKDSPENVVARIVFDIARDKGKLRSINQVFFQKAAELGIRQAVSEIAGASGEALKQAVDSVKRSQAIRESMTISNSKITGINEVTKKRLTNSLLDGLKKEEGLNDLTKRVQEQLGDNRARALKIARTQTAGAVGSGRHAGFKHTGVELKGWVTSGDEHVRKIHVTAGKEYAKGIPLDEAFWVGGEKLMHPGDPHGTPVNVANCRCVEVAIKAKGKMFTFEYWSNYKFYTYEDMKAAA
jgi:HK97 family phage portal protein